MTAFTDHRKEWTPTPKASLFCEMCCESGGKYNILERKGHIARRICVKCILIAKKIFSTVDIDYTNIHSCDRDYHPGGILVLEPPKQMSVSDAIDTLANALKERL